MVTLLWLFRNAWLLNGYLQNMLMIIYESMIMYRDAHNMLK